MSNYPLVLDQPASLKRVRETLDKVGFGEKKVFAVLGGGQESPAVDTSQLNLPKLLNRTSGKTPLETLIRLLLLRTAVDQSAFQKAVAPCPVQDWIDVGLIRPDKSAFVSTVQVAPILDRILIVCDWRTSDNDPEVVLGVTRSAWGLAQWTMRQQSEAFLDLGTGCGIQAFLAAAFSQHVAGVDINPRAVHLARFGAELNELGNIELLEGDFFAPVSERQFDQIVANPPFVVSPEKRFLFRDSGEQGDTVSERLVRMVPRFLREDGSAQIVCNWIHPRDQDWQQRLSSWFEGAGCDIWVLHTSMQEVADYAQQWIRDTNEQVVDMPSLLKAWMDYYTQQGIEAISSGMLILRKRAGDNWFRYDQVAKPKGPAGDSIAYGIAARTLIEDLNNDTLLSQELHVPSDVRLEQILTAVESGWSIAEANIRHVGGLGFSARIDGHLLALVNRFHRRRSVEDVLTELAESIGEPLPQLRRAALPAVRGLIEKGFLRPVHKA